MIKYILLLNLFTFSTPVHAVEKQPNIIDASQKIIYMLNNSDVIIKSQSEIDHEKFLRDLEDYKYQKITELNDLEYISKNDYTIKINSAKTFDEIDGILNSAKNENNTILSTPKFGPDGLLIMTSSDRAQQVVNLLLYIPGHANGAQYHIETGLDSLIDQLTVEEAIWVLWRIEGPGFGQTGSGHAGYDSPESHRALLDKQIYGREEFNGSIHQLLKYWGTFQYTGY